MKHKIHITGTFPRLSKAGYGFSRGVVAAFKPVQLPDCNQNIKPPKMKHKNKIAAFLTPSPLGRAGVRLWVERGLSC